MIKNHRTLLKSLLIKIQSQDFKGYDPYDLKAHPFFIKLIKWGNQSKFGEIVREIILELTYHYPEKARTLFNIKPSHNSKALGLISTACVELSLLNQFDKSILSSIESRTKELLEDYKTTTKSGIGWGYPFDWQSTELIPAQTPNGIVTTAVGEYYWSSYQTSKNAGDLETCVSIAQFLSGLPFDRLSDSEICFSYIPHYQNHVHNLNLFIADFLIKVGIETGNKEWIEAGNQAVNYTINDQHSDGAFDYNGPPEKPQNFIDNYHTGFVLRMLGSIHHYTKREDVEKSLKLGLTYYLDNFFLENGSPKLKPNRTYRIDIHSAAEAINCLVFLANFDKRAFSKASKVLEWTLDNLYDSVNHDFYYAMMKSRFTGGIYRSKIKYMRWSQAWMLRALSRYMLYSENKKIIL
jgi:hypothetical protein